MARMIINLRRLHSMSADAIRQAVPFDLVSDGVLIATVIAGEGQDDYHPSVIPLHDTRFRQAGIVPNQTYRERALAAPPPEPPLYDPQVHKPGDVVRVQRGKQVLTLSVPDLDGDGHPVPP